MSRCCGRWLIILFLCFFCSCVVCCTVFRSVGESKNAINLTARKKVCLHARKMEKFLKWNKNISIAEHHNEQRFSFGESLYHITTPDHKRIFLILHSRLYLIKLFYGKWKYIEKKFHLCSFVIPHSLVFVQGNGIRYVWKLHTLPLRLNWIFKKSFIFCGKLTINVNAMCTHVNSKWE